MSKRTNYLDALIAIDKAIIEFDKVAVKTNDSFARKQYLELTDIVCAIKTHILEEEANERTNETPQETTQSVGTGQTKESSEDTLDFDPSLSGC